ncbi:hypothetical protein M9Y10_007054 [Tritrichomonas musculus]|uniref:F5/8 type C domain-containing protein n=1 Tax=Tritrichomonas musculus TaxID=1915356 RepID=A0ABR2J1C6_9EUKA
MIFAIILALKLPFIKQTTISQNDDYDYLSYGPVNGNFADSDYKNLHEIAKDDFTFGSSGARDSYNIENAFDGNPNSYWISEQAESNTFHPSIFINFTSPTLFEGFIYRAAYHEIDKIFHFDGFPSKLKVFTAQTENDPFILNSIFTGEKMGSSDSVQFVLSNPVLCTRLKIEFHDLSTTSSFHINEKLACVKEITLYRNYEYDLVYHKGVTGLYRDSNYINLHKITNFKANSNGDRENFPFSYALDDNKDSKWVSEKPQTDSFFPTIFANFTGQINFEGLIYSVCRHKKNAYDGFPSKLYIYTALNEDDEFKLHTVFTGTQKDEKVQFILSKPVKCSRIMIELHDVGDYESEGKYAASDCLVFLQSFDYQELIYQKVGGNYKKDQYKDFHKIPKDIISVGTNGDAAEQPIDFALDTDENSFWKSKDPESETFHPTVFVNFTEPTLFEALIYDIKSKKGTPRKYYGFPNKMFIYVALGDEPFTLKFMYKGKPEDPNMLILFPEPINCTKLMFEFYDVMDSDTGGKYAEADGFHFYRNFEYEQISYQKVNDVYENENYIEFHKIPENIISVGTNGDDAEQPIDFALDTDENSFWKSKDPESETFHPSVFVNFTEPTLFEALIYDIKSKKGTPRKYYGFPEKVILYTSLGDEPLTPKILFQGEAQDPHMLFLLSKPINCTRMMFEFHYITDSHSGGKYAEADGFHFFRSFTGEAEKFEPFSQRYNDPAFIESNKVPDDKFTYDCNGFQTDHPLSYAFNDDMNQFWISNTENSNDFKASIDISFKEPVLLEAILFYATYYDQKKKPREFSGFPLRLNVYSANNDSPFKLNTKFAEVPLSSWDKMQFVFPSPIRCTKLRLEFDQVTTNHYSNNERKACVKKLTFISQKLVDYTNSNFTDDLEVIYVNDEFYLDEVTDSSFSEYYLPKSNDYLFVVKRDFTFINDVFSCKTHKAGAIESNLAEHVKIKRCKFISCTVKSEKKNGGAINFINCGIVCESSDFTDCKSMTGGKGGGIYLTINSPISEDSLINGCTFSGCTAYYGGGAYVYSNDKTRIVTFQKCIFTQNKVIDSDARNEPSAGSALYLMTAKSKIVKCKFSKNEGSSSVHIAYYFENDEKENIKLKSNDEIKSIIIDDCMFNIHPESKSSISLVHKSDENAPIYLNNCVFNGKLSKNAHFIEGSIEYNEKIQNIYIHSCRFSSDTRNALHLYYSNSTDELVSYVSINEGTKHKKSSRENIILFSLITITAIFVISIISALIIHIQKKSDI